MLKNSYKLAFFIWFLAKVVFSQSPIYEPQAVTGQLCAIPFVYKGNVYHDCTTVDSTQPWCYLDDGFHNWDYCKPQPSEFNGCGVANPNITVDEVNEILNEHNRVRGQISALRMRQLIWNSELAQRAQYAANECAHQHVEKTLCGNREQCGQNLYYTYYDMGYPGYSKWTNVIKSWSAEQAFYDITSNKCQDNHICGHFTQVAWARTFLIGCGKAACHGDVNGKVQYSIQYYCNYFSSGNVIGDYPYIQSNNSKCQNCYLFDANVKFRCDTNQLCETCKNGHTDCIGIEDIKSLSDAGKICADTDVDCGLNLNLCVAMKAGVQLPSMLVEYLKKCKKTCGTCS